MEPPDQDRDAAGTTGGSVEVADFLDALASPTPELAAKKSRDTAWLRQHWLELRDSGYEPKEMAQLACIMISQAIIDCESQVAVLDLCELLNKLIPQAINMGTGLHTKVHKDAPKIIVPSRYN